MFAVAVVCIVLHPYFFRALLNFYRLMYNKQPRPGLALFSTGTLGNDDSEVAGPANTTNCIFERNSAIDGGGMYSSAGYDILQDLWFEGNVAGDIALDGFRKAFYTMLPACIFFGQLLHFGVLCLPWLSVESV